MASVFTHTVVAVVLGKTYTSHKMPVRFWVYSILCSALPDADSIGFHLGVPYWHALGHRGLSHSLFFALILGITVSTAAFRENKMFSKAWWSLSLYFAVVTASHGLLDALTSGGLGIAFFSPFDRRRFFFPWRPILVSPIEISLFFSKWGLHVILSEILWVWVPFGVLYLFVLLTRRFLASRTPP